MALDVRRRQLLSVLGGAVITSSLAARAQQPAMPLIGVLSGQSPEISERVHRRHFIGYPRETGFIEGRDVIIGAALSPKRQ